MIQDSFLFLFVFILAMTLAISFGRILQDLSTLSEKGRTSKQLALLNVDEHTIPCTVSINLPFRMFFFSEETNRFVVILCFLFLSVRETSNYVERVVIGVWFVIASVVCLVRTFFFDSAESFAQTNIKRRTACFGSMLAGINKCFSIKLKQHLHSGYLFPKSIFLPITICFDQFSKTITIFGTGIRQLICKASVKRARITSHLR